MQKVILSIGANIGPIKENLKSAVKNLELNGIENIKLSSVYKNPPVGCPPNTPDFYNMAISGIWHKSPFELLKICKELELIAGRPSSHPKWSSRPLDIDIIFFGLLKISTRDLIIPHRDALNRIFVVLPAAEIEPDFIPPNSDLTLSQILLNKFSPTEIRLLLANAAPLDFL